MNLTLRGKLPFVSVTIFEDGASLVVSNVLVDTGSVGTLFNADIVASLGILPRSDDRIRSMRGVGGSEFVYTRRVDRLEVFGRGLDDFEIEVGEMNYGFDFGGILGMDFLVSAGALLNLRDLTLDFAEPRRFGAS